jgi:glycogen synthase
VKHLIVSREFPPAPYPPGGIGTYVRSMAQLLAKAGETVHVIAQRWDGAPKPIEETEDGRLIVHRVSLREPVVSDPDERARLRALAASDCPYQVFSWQAARLAESLIEREGIDVVEAQEYEAPLYFLQRRRAAGEGPQRQPPILITLHSPSEFIFRYNDWDTTLTDFPPLRQLEAYTIAAADWLVCPSRYLATQAAHHYQLAPASIDIIPNPVGELTPVDRSPSVWVSNRICYVGRLELRKGVLELVRAGVALAGEDSTVQFDFVGADTSLSGGPGATVLPRLLKEIPRHLNARFRFHGSQPKAVVRKLQQESCAAVVPARWENLPYSCLEAMALGLPIVVSPAGGMAELIEDGKSGWLAPDPTAAGLSVALRRLMATPGEQRARMGKEAASAVQRICGAPVLARHLELRRRLASHSTRHTPRISSLRGDAGQGSADEPAPSGKDAQVSAAPRGRPDAAHRRYSLGALALGRFQKSFFEWFLSAPLPAKVMAVRHALRRPSETARWVAWHARHFGDRLWRAGPVSDPALNSAGPSNRAAGRQ